MASKKAAATVRPATSEEAEGRRDLLRQAYVTALFGFVRRKPGEKVPIYKFITPEMKLAGINKRWVDTTLAKYKALNPAEFDTTE